MKKFVERILSALLVAAVVVSGNFGGVATVNAEGETSANEAEAVVTPNQVYEYDCGGGTACVGVVLADPTGVTDVTFFVWSVEGDQDDIISVAGKMVAENQYQANVDATAHMTGGMLVHAYATRNGVSEFLGLTYATMENANMTLIAQTLASPTGTIVLVDKSQNIFGIYTYDGEKYVYVRGNYCTTGAGGCTPTGTYSIGRKGYSFGTADYTCYYYSGFIGGTYLFHSVLYYPGTFKVKSPKLGKYLSHGCIRLDINDAKFLQDYVLSGSTVYIYK